MTKIAPKTDSDRAYSSLLSLGVHCILLSALVWPYGYDLPPQTISGEEGTKYLSVHVLSEIPAIAPPLEPPILSEPLPEAAPNADLTPKTKPQPLTDKAPPTQSLSAGDPKAQLTWLQQIARCLPPNVRPDLRPATLRLSVDAEGYFKAAPALDINLTGLDAAQTKQANQIIQAALQCGPYETGQEAIIDLPADFSAIETQVAQEG